MRHRSQWTEESFDDAAALKRFGVVHAGRISHG
jgi:hypothetical protein